jgi:exodeoxyribonuclease V alpha subunit
MTTKQAIPSNVEFEGRVDLVTFANAETGYAVIKVKVDPKRYRNDPCVNKQGRITICGKLAREGTDGKTATVAEPGEKIRVTGRMTHHPRFGTQVEVTTLSPLEPKGRTEMVEYLAKNVFRIGPTLATKIVEKLGPEAFKIIDANPDVLDDIPGIGAKRLGEIKKIWVEQGEYRSMLMFCTNLGITTTFIERIFKKYKSAAKAVEIIKADPYRLARDVDGIGFSRADDIAKHLGIHELSEVRIRAACEHILQEKQQEGHCFQYSGELIADTVKFLDDQNINEGVVGTIVQRAIEQRILVLEEPNRLYLPGMAISEHFVAGRLKRLLSTPMPVQCQGEQSLKFILDAAAASTTVQLHPTQCEAIWRTLTSKVSVITGGPGVGKTTITKAVVAGFRKTGLPIMLLAPTGRAAKRMAEVIGTDAQTIHRHLFRLHTAVKKGEATLEQVRMRGVVIVDEVSMMDVKLAAWLLEYVDDTAVVVFVGDKDQLPSVGPGAVLRDLLRCEAVPKTMLTHIFRQAAGSKIIVNAHKINEGTMPMWDYLTRNSAWPQTDMWCAMIDDAEEQAQCVVWAATELAKQFGLDPVKDCMVLAPMKNGAAGVFNLNANLQRALNPQPPKSVERPGGVRWGVGDKVMQLKNNYNLGVLNGDIGVIVDVVVQDNALRELKVDFDGDLVTYSKGDQWMDLTLAYASTIHKVQGSESPMVVICCHTSHYMLLQRNLLYTGVTRGKKFVLLIAARAALSRAIGNNEVARRNTFLAEKVMKELR